jgi:hypothetical protein
LLRHCSSRTSVAASNATFDEIINHENPWMAKLGTRVHGLNRPDAGVEPQRHQAP